MEFTKFRQTNIEKKLKSSRSIPKNFEGIHELLSPSMHDNNIYLGFFKDCSIVIFSLRFLMKNV